MENGFYIWIPKDQEEDHYLSLDQVVQVIEGTVWVTGIGDQCDVEVALKHGEFGKCVMNDKGVTI